MSLFPEWVTAQRCAKDEAVSCLLEKLCSEHLSTILPFHPQHKTQCLTPTCLSLQCVCLRTTAMMCLAFLEMFTGELVISSRNDGSGCPYLLDNTEHLNKQQASVSWDCKTWVFSWCGCLLGRRYFVKAACTICDWLIRGRFNGATPDFHIGAQQHMPKCMWHANPSH